MTCAYAGCTRPRAQFIDSRLGLPAAVSAFCEHHVCRVCFTDYRANKDTDRCKDCVGVAAAAVLIEGDV